MTAETTLPSIFPVDLLQQHQEFLENDNKSKISAKWRSCFLETLREISRQVNPPTFSLNQDACFYVEDLLFTLLTRIFDIKPLCIGDVTKFVLKTFPEPLNRWSIDDAQKIFLNNTNHHKRNNYAARLLTFPNNKVYAMLKEVYNYRFDAQVVNYVLSILQYIAQDVLRLTGNYVKNIRHTIITFQDLKVAMTADNVLMDLFFRDEDQDLNSPAVDFLLEEQHLSSPLFADNLNYEQSVKSLIHQETQYLRDLNMLIFVFHENFKRIDNKNLYENENFLNLERIFGNLFDVKDFTIRFCALLEDKLDIEREENLQVGVCFAEMAQAYEFDVYHMYIQNIMNPQTMEYIQNLTVKNRILADELEDIQPGFKLAVKYLLPQLLLLPVKHCAEYFDYITSLKKLATSEDDLNDFSDAESLLLMLKKRLDTHANSLVRQILPNKLTQNVSPNARCAAAKSKLNALCKQVENFENKVKIRNASDFLLEGPLCKYSSQPKLGSSLLGATDTLRKGSRCATTSRYAYLFDNMLILCKSVGPAMSSSMTLTADSVVATSPKCLKFKEYLSIRRLEVLDRDDLEDVKYAFEIRTKAASSQQQNSESLESGIVLSAKSAVDKQTWMSNLVTLQMRRIYCLILLHKINSQLYIRMEHRNAVHTNRIFSTLERMLDASLSAEEERIPLILPSVEQYRFAEKDSEENIVFEDYVSSSGLPIVRGATLPKLVERLTYNQYSHQDANFWKMFLMTYRSFCEPRELLNLLLERFFIPDPNFGDFVQNYNQQQQQLQWDRISCSTEISNFSSMTTATENGASTSDFDPFLRDVMKKFRKDYAQPIQIRVLSCLRHWIELHYYDFDQDPQLLKMLKDFLLKIEDSKYKYSKMWSKNVREALNRKELTKNEQKQFTFTSDPPAIEWHLPTKPSEYDLMTLHPVEIARQVTLLEFDLYRNVKPFELVGAPFGKKDKKKRSPQLTKLIKHTSNFAYYLEKMVVESENLDERVSVVNRILEIMCVFQELNNFNGLFEIYSALVSAAVDRLWFTWERLDKNLLKKFNEVKQLFSDPRHNTVRGILKNSINPPCIPYFGTYLTSLTFLNERKTFLEQSQQENNSLSPKMDENSYKNENVNLINVAKCRKVYEIIGEIQLYQDQAYNLKVEPSMKHFFESLNPLDDFNDNANDLQTYLYEKSVAVEPKDAEKPPYFKMKRDPSTLKSPGIRQSAAPCTSSAASSAARVQKSSSKSGVTSAVTGSISFTPLIKPREKIGRSTTVSPPSPSFSMEEAPHSLIEIEPGRAPRYIRNVPSTSGVVAEASPPPPPHAARNRSNSNSGRPTAAPPVPPRQTSSTMSNGCRSLSASSNDAAPVLPPRTFVAAGRKTEQRFFTFPDVNAPPLPPRRTPTQTDAAMSSSPPPPLMPRRSTTEPPPPRPPKNMMNTASADAPTSTPPPLPPKTYRSS